MNKNVKKVLFILLDFYRYLYFLFNKMFDLLRSNEPFDFWKKLNVVRFGRVLFRL